MNLNYNDRYNKFKQYCIKNETWLESKKLPFIKLNQSKETIFVEFRELNYNYFIIRNAIRVLDESWSHTIVCGKNNFKFMLKIKERINRNIRIIKCDVENMTRLQYSLMLLKSNFWKQFNGDHLLIYQEDSIIFRDIPKYYFNFDFVGAPLFNKTIGNGGLSLRNKIKMMSICNNYDGLAEQFEKCRLFLETKIEFLRSVNIDYKKDNRFLFLYKIEKSLLEDILICNKCNKLPSFIEANEFSVEKYYYKNPIGGHQFWYTIENIDNWLDLNLKKNY